MREEEEKRRGIMAGQELVEGKGRGIGREGTKRKRARAREGDEEGASSPFYSESGTPGYCQVTLGQSLD